MYNGMVQRVGACGEQTSKHNHKHSHNLNHSLLKLKVERVLEPGTQHDAPAARHRNRGFHVEAKVMITLTHMPLWVNMKVKVTLVIEK